MSILQRITNPNADIEAKVNYFIDRFYHCNLYGGLESNLEMETPLSLIEKIHFNLTSNPNYKRDVFEVYFSHDIISDEDLWEDLPIYQKVLPVFKSYLAAPKKSRPSILDSSSFERDLSKLLEELRFKAPDILFNALMSIILCPHPLEEHEHIKKLDLMARLIVSEGYFSGKTMIEISELVDRIFLKEEKNFPFPNEVKKSERQRYINADNLRNQLSGFKRLMQRNITKGYVMMKAFSVERFPDDFEFAYNGVQFFGKAHPKLITIKNQFVDDHDFADFFDIGDFIFVATKLEYFSQGSLAEHMLEATKEQLAYLSAVLFSEIQLDKTKNYLLLNARWKYIGYNIRLSKEKPKFSKNRLYSISDNPFEILSKLRKKSSSEWFLAHEPLFIQAHRDKGISAYWQYLEALLPEDDKGNKQIKDLLPNLLLLNERKNTENRIIETFYSSLDFLSGGHRILDIPLQELNKVRTLLLKRRLHPAILKNKYPFINQMREELTRVYDASYFEQVKRYYLAILVEAYNIRNFDIHAGSFHRKSILKIQRSLPRLVVRLRWVIMDAIKEHPELPFHLLVEQLMSRSREL